MAFPTSIDSFSNPQGTTLVATDDHALQHRIEGSAIVALENKVGLASGSAAANQILVGQGAGTTQWGSVWNNATLGTPRTTGGTLSGAVVGTNTITGGTINGQVINGGTIANGVYGTALYQGGTAANMAIGTPTILAGTILINGTTIPFNFGAAIAPTVGTLSDSPSGTFTPNAQAAQFYEITFGTNAVNRTAGTPTNLTNGQFFGYRIKNNAAGVGTILFNPIYRFPSGGTPSLGTAGTWNYFSFRYNATDAKLDYQGGITGLI